MIFSIRNSLPRILLLSLLSTPSVLAAFETCYWPDGSVAEGQIPCGDGSGHSACCGPNADGTCLNGGLCWSKFGHIVRHSCTDKDWNDSACPKVCVDKKDPRSKKTYQILVACNSFNRFACYDESKPEHNECAEGNFTMPFQPEITTYGNISVNLIQAMASQASTQSVVTVTATGSSESSGNDNGGSSDNKGNMGAFKIGAGVGIPLGLAFLAALGMYLYERRARQRLQKELEARDIAMASKPLVQAAYSPGYTAGSDSSNTLYGGHGQGGSSPFMQQKYIPEVHGNTVTPQANELSSAVPPQELPGSGSELHR